MNQQEMLDLIKTFHKQMSAKGGKKGGVNRWKDVSLAERRAYGQWLAAKKSEKRANKTALDNNQATA